MGERNQETTSSESLDDLFEPVIGDLAEEELRDVEFRIVEVRDATQ